MILTDQFEINKIENLTSSYIEDELVKLNIVPLRWAIVEVTTEKYILSVSYEQN